VADSEQRRTQSKEQSASYNSSEVQKPKVKKSKTTKDAVSSSKALNSVQPENRAETHKYQAKAEV